MIRFTQLPDKLRYPPSVKATLSTYHSSVIEYCVQHFVNTFSFREKAVETLNVLSYILCNQDALPDGWSQEAPFEGLYSIDEDLLRKYLTKLPHGSLYLSEKNIEWDVEPVEDSPTELSQPEERKTHQNLTQIPKNSTDNVETKNVFDKSDLYIQPPVVPQFDISCPVISATIESTNYTMYRSLPIIPRKQNQISCTTDVNLMTDEDLLRLYPPSTIHTRAACMYENYEGLTTHPDLGVVIPVEGFTEMQLLENLIKYPHIFRLKKLVKGSLEPFYSTIEIDGVLYNTIEHWSKMEDTKKLPKTAEFMKEYVVRRYLLERDVKKTDHRYKMFGELDPYLTLFTTPEKYVLMGVSDIVGTAKKCVLSRVRYKRSRNPVLRKVAENA